MATDGDNTFLLLNCWFKDVYPGFVELSSTSNGTDAFGGVLYRRCTGSESGSNVTLQTNENEAVYAVVMKISGNPTHEYAVLAGTAATGSSSTPDPPSIAALKESRDVLYLACAAWDHNDAYSSNPSNYSTVQNGNSGTGSGDCGGAVAYREITSTSSSEDPGTF